MEAPTRIKKVTLIKSILPVVLLAFLLIIALKFVLEEIHYYSLNKEILGRFFPIKWWLIGHLSGGIIALLIGPFQFWSAFRTRYFKIHRRLGRIYLVAIVIGAFSSTYMAWNTALAIHWTWAFSLQVLGVVWLTTAYMAFRSIRKMRIEQHREWMIRSYIVTFGFILFRWINNSPLLESLGNFIERAPTVIWFVWAIPLFVAEVVFQWNK